MNSELKDDVIALIKKLPDDSTLDDIIYHLYVKKKIEKGLEQVKEGRTIPHEQVMENAKKRLKEWLK